jgi:FtsH-binding integral membrane protein
MSLLGGAAAVTTALQHKPIWMFFGLFSVVAAAIALGKAPRGSLKELVERHVSWIFCVLGGLTIGVLWAMWATPGVVWDGGRPSMLTMLALTGLQLALLTWTFWRQRIDSTNAAHDSGIIDEK